MVWDPNQEGCIDKFGGKILLSANQKKNITSTANKTSEFVVLTFNYLNTLCTCICIKVCRWFDIERLYIHVVNKNNDT